MGKLQPRPSLPWAPVSLAALFIKLLCTCTSSPRSRNFVVDAFSPHAAKKFTIPRHNNVDIPRRRIDSSSLCATKKKKLSMAQKRKKRGKKLPPRPVERPAILDTTAPVDEWDKPKTTDEQVAQMKEQEHEAKIKAAALIESQRKSVDTLTLIKEKVEALAYEDIAKSLEEKGYFVQDGFIGDPDLIAEMEGEGLSMFREDKLERDVASLETGEFTAKITGGQDQYADCPRIVEYIVSLTRHMPPLLDDQDVLDCPLDATASMGSLRVFDRKARESSLVLLKEPPPPKPFRFANDGNPTDQRMVAVIYFLAESAWDEECGGGVTFGSEDSEMVTVDAVRDRLLIFRSDTCSHRTNSSVGKEGLENNVCLVNHLLRKTKDENQV